MAQRVVSRPDMYCYEAMSDFDWDTAPCNENDNGMETSSTDSSSEHNSPTKPIPQISPEKFPLSLKLHDTNKQFRQPSVNPDVAYMVRQSEWLQTAMAICGNKANDTYEKALQARKDQEHEKAAQYDTRTNEYMFQYNSAAESSAKVNNAFRQGIYVVPTVNKEKNKPCRKPSFFVSKANVAGHERRGEPKLQSGIDFASEKAFPESGGKDARGEPMQLVDNKV